MSGSDATRQRPSGVKLTYDDFVLFPDDGKRHELIDGEHYVTPAPNRKHQSIVGNVHGPLLTTPLMPGLEILLPRVFRESGSPTYGTGTR
jgi:hypothetical protein